MEDNAIKDSRNLFRLIRMIDDNIIKNVRNVFRPKKENEGIKDKIKGDSRNLFELENFVTVAIILNTKVIVTEIKDLRKSDTWNIQLTIAINYLLKALMKST